MRLNEQGHFFDESMPGAGTILVAHPSMHDPNFARTVVFLTVHNPAQGSLGVVVNRALEKTLGEYDPELTDSPLADVPLYEGGPVASDKLILAAWKWIEDESTFRLYFGIDGEKAEKILKEDPEFEIRGFMGHAGWSEGQLDAELDQGAWVMSGWLPELQKKHGEAVWRSILCHENPAMRVLTDVPEDPSVN
ncbi:MAG: YqgE/AlgH family protein [Verrucomicrobiota bacterium]